METATEVLQVRITKKGDAQVHRAARSEPVAAVAAPHDRIKPRLLDPADPDVRAFLTAVGVADHEGRIKPTRQDKYRQVEEFVRLLDASVEDARKAGALTEPTPENPWRLVDLGCGHAYLTMGAYVWLAKVRGLPVRVHGVDVREDSRARNAALAAELGWGDELTFEAATIADARDEPRADVVLALHACDTATDDALARAVHWGTAVVLAAPCCHHDLQAQMAKAETPSPYSLVTRHGLLRERFVDVLTDAIRAALLRIVGYRVDTVEFVSDEHTNRNLMIRAVRTGAAPSASDLADYDALLAEWHVAPRSASASPTTSVSHASASARERAPRHPDRCCRLVPRSTSRRLLLSALGGGAAAPAAAANDASSPHVVCRFSDQRLVEISGITWSRRHPGVYWLHNDSGGGPYLYAVDGTTCRTLARIRIGNIGARDIEAIATGTDPQGRSVLWVGDIGDNRDSWPSVRLHAVVEPARLVDQQLDAVTYRFTYADQPHNAEGIIAEPDRAKVWVVTKQLAAGTVWQVPLSTSKVTRGVAVGDVGGLATDAAMSRDGTRFVVRDYLRAYLYDAPVSAASLASPTRVELPFEVQGEAITFAPDDQALLVAGEQQNELWWVPLSSSIGTSGSATPSTSRPRRRRQRLRERVRLRPRHRRGRRAGRPPCRRHRRRVAVGRDRHRGRGRPSHARLTRTIGPVGESVRGARTAMLRRRSATTGLG